MEKKSVFITGASTGIGLACAQKFHQAGYLVFAGFRKEGVLSQYETESFIPVKLDITNHEDILRCKEDLEKKHSVYGLDLLINNAGIAVAGPVEGIAAEDLRKQFEVNVVGLVCVTQTFLPLLRKNKGTIINLSSISGRSSFPFLGAYTGSKHAVEAISDSMRYELAKFGIKIIIIEPGAVATPIWGKAEKDLPGAMEAFGAEIQSLYPELQKVLVDTIRDGQKRGIPPAKVADLIYKVSLKKNPKARYPIGMDAKAGILLRWLLPAKIYDFIIQHI